MIADIFGSKEIVRIFDFLLDDPFGQYTKSEIANGASVSRPTVQKLIPVLIRMGVLQSTRKFGITELLEMNVSSPLVISLMKFDSELSKALVNSKVEQLYTNSLEDFASDIKHWIDGRTYYINGEKLIELQMTNPQKEENDEYIRVIRNSIPSSA